LYLLPLVRVLLVLVCGLGRVEAFAKLPNGDSSYSATGNAGSLRRVVSDWIDEGTSKSTVVATYGAIEEWDVSDVTNMIFLFYGDQLTSTFGSFNADLSKWNTSAVTSMFAMFFSASAFNSDVSKWKTGAVTTMSYMFASAFVFNRDVAEWNTGGVTSMQGSKCNLSPSLWSRLHVVI